MEPLLHVAAEPFQVIALEVAAACPFLDIKAETFGEVREQLGIPPNLSRRGPK
jgi:hypothetical protein